MARITSIQLAHQVRATFNGIQYLFRSQFEYKWAKYLQFLQEHKHIWMWDYEVARFDFEGRKNKPRVYIPDFVIRPTVGGTTFFFHECKGRLTKPDISKFRCMSQHYPDEEIQLVMQRMPKKGDALLRIQQARKYCSRIIDASEIFRQTKGLVDYSIPTIQGEPE